HRNLAGPPSPHEAWLPRTVEPPLAAPLDPRAGGGGECDAASGDGVALAPALLPAPPPDRDPLPCLRLHAESGRLVPARPHGGPSIQPLILPRLRRGGHLDFPAGRGRRGEDPLVGSLGT